MKNPLIYGRIDQKHVKQIHIKPYMPNIPKKTAKPFTQLLKASLIAMVVAIPLSFVLKKLEVDRWFAGYIVGCTLMLIYHSLSGRPS